MEVVNGVAGTAVHIACGEALTGDTVGYTWGCVGGVGWEGVAAGAATGW